MTADPLTVARRRRTLDLLAELHRAGLVEYTVTPAEVDGPEPQVRVTALPADVVRSAPPSLSPAAAALWEQMRFWRAGESRRAPGQAAGDG